MDITLGDWSDTLMVGFHRLNNGSWGISNPKLKVGVRYRIRLIHNKSNEKWEPKNGQDTLINPDEIDHPFFIIPPEVCERFDFSNDIDDIIFDYFPIMS